MKFNVKIIYKFKYFFLEKNKNFSVIFQNVFHLKIYQNNIYFYFLKFISDISISK
jgi:hypothetical protein